MGAKNPRLGILSPQQSLFLSGYLNPKSNTFSDVYNSAINAGYADSYAKVMSAEMPVWIQQALNKSSLVTKARRNIEAFLDLPEDDPNKLRVKADMTKFVAERVDKENFSTRQEITGAGGGPIQSDSHISVDQRIAQIQAELKDL